MLISCCSSLQVYFADLAQCTVNDSAVVSAQAMGQEPCQGYAKAED